MSVATIAAEALDFFGTACQEIAFGEPWEGGWDKKAEAWVKQAREAGCEDLPGAYADVLYNDPDTAMDFIGDRLCDECGDDDELYEAVVDALSRGMPWMPESLFKNLRRKKVDA